MRTSGLSSFLPFFQSQVKQSVEDSVANWRSSASRTGTAPKRAARGQKDKSGRRTKKEPSVLVTAIGATAPFYCFAVVSAKNTRVRLSFLLTIHHTTSRSIGENTVKLLQCPYSSSLLSSLPFGLRSPFFLRLLKYLRCLCACVRTYGREDRRTDSFSVFLDRIRIPPCNLFRK